MTRDQSLGVDLIPYLTLPYLFMAEFLIPAQNNSH